MVVISRKQATEIAFEIIQEGEFGEFWIHLGREKFDVVSCDWSNLEQEWMVKIRSWRPEDGRAWLMFLALNSAGELTRSIHNVEEHFWLYVLIENCYSLIIRITGA